ncbi:MAG: hypothetical protein ABIF04_00250, partial [Chloroflexota bacterium]
MQTSDLSTKNSFERLTSFLPLMWFSLAFLTGILVANQIHVTTMLWLILAGIALILVALARVFLSRLGTQPFHLSPSHIFLLTLSLVAFFLGAARYQSTIPNVDAHHIAWYADREYELLVTGTLTDPPDERD